MNKVISFGPEQDPSLLQLRLIAFNVVDYAIKQANKIVYPDVNPDYISIQNTGRFYCNWKYPEAINDLVQTIEIDTDFADMTKYDNNITDVYNFVKTYGIYKYRLATYVFVLLHECGHMVNTAYITQRLKGKLEYYVAMQDNIESAIFLALSPYVEDGEYDSPYDYNYNPVEAVANQFAYLNFKKAWDMLIARGLIL